MWDDDDIAEGFRPPPAPSALTRGVTTSAWWEYLQAADPLKAEAVLAGPVVRAGGVEAAAAVADLATLADKVGDFVREWARVCSLEAMFQAPYAIDPASAELLRSAAELSEYRRGGGEGGEVESRAALERFRLAVAALPDQPDPLLSPAPPGVTRLAMPGLERFLRGG